MTEVEIPDARQEAAAPSRSQPPVACCETMKSYWFVFCRDELLLRRQPDGRLAVPLGEEAPVCLAPEQTVQPLPDLGGVPCRAVGLDAPVVAEGCVMMGLRASFDVLELPVYRMAGKARELLYWDASTRFCGVCGAPLRRSSAISKRCPACGRTEAERCRKRILW